MTKNWGSNGKTARVGAQMILKFSETRILNLKTLFSAENKVFLNFDSGKQNQTDDLLNAAGDMRLYRMNIIE